MQEQCNIFGNSLMPKPSHMIYKEGLHGVLSDIFVT